uniref:Uncharacterized protein n=1 Tax=Fagus sylvatica TaxID=28930 RepID=A0A2N9HYY4_FAGSY
MASKLAMLVNTEESMARFRSLYQIPPSVSLTYCNSDDFPVINRDEILLPIMAIVEGGVRFPLHSFLIDFLQTVNATPSQISVNTFRIIMGVIAINRLLDVNLTIREVLAVYQYKCLGPKSNTLSHLVARNVNEKLVNGLPSTNKGFEKDYLRVGGDWWPGSSRCRSEFGQPGGFLRQTSALMREENHASAPLLLGYEPQVKSFLEGPVVPRSEAVEIPPRAPYIAQPAEVERPEDFPDRIPTGQVYAMAPPLNPFKLMGKTADAGPSKEKEKPRQKAKVRRLDAPEEKEEASQGLSCTRDTRVAHGLSFAACLPEDMKRWASTQPGDAFRPNDPRPNDEEGSRTEKTIRSLLKAAGDDYTRLEGQHHKNIAIMKEAEERARVEETRRAEAETIMKGAEERARVEETRRVEAEAEIGMEEGLVKGEELGLLKGKELGREGAMGEVTAQFKMVYNTGFRHGWKSALSKTGQPEMSELFLRTNTPLPYPNAGLRNSDDEGDEEDEEGEEEEEEEEEEDEEGPEERRR